MKVLKLMLLVLAFGCVENSAQPPAAAPPPPPEQSRFKIGVETPKSDYILKSDGFKINFPAKPTRTVTPIDTAYGKADFVTYQLPSRLVVYSANYIDFPTEITDRTEIMVRFEMARDALLKDPESSLISQTEVVFGEYPGMDFVIEGKSHTIYIRALFIKQRFFQLGIVAAGKQSRATPRVKQYNKKVLDEFINSFVVTELPKIQTEAVELPSDFGVKFENSIFSSRFFGYSVTLPSGWTAIEKEETDILKDLGTQATQLKSEVKKEALKSSVNNTEILLMLTKFPIQTAENNSIILIAAERVSFPNFLPLALAKSFGEELLEPNERMIKPASAIKIGGVDFAWTEIEDTSDKTKQRFFVANRNGIAFQILLSYKNSEDLKEMLNAITTSKFANVK